MTDIQGEMASRGRLESERTELLWRAGSMLGVPAEAVELSELTGLMRDADADEARMRSAELRGLLAEIAREHGINRALMRQELAFLSHLTRLVGNDAEPGYNPPGAAGTPAGGRGRRRGPSWRRPAGTPRSPRRT